MSDDDRYVASDSGRVETGRYQFDDDWPGLFIRGDDCMGFYMTLTKVLEAYWFSDDVHLKLKQLRDLLGEPLDRSKS